MLTKRVAELGVGRPLVTVLSLTLGTNVPRCGPRSLWHHDRCFSCCWVQQGDSGVSRGADRAEQDQEYVGTGWRRRGRRTDEHTSMTSRGHRYRPCMSPGRTGICPSDGWGTSFVRMAWVRALREGAAGPRWPSCRAGARTAAAGGRPQAGLRCRESLPTAGCATPPWPPRRPLGPERQRDGRGDPAAETPRATVPGVSARRASPPGYTAGRRARTAVSAARVGEGSMPMSWRRSSRLISCCCGVVIAFLMVAGGSCRGGGGCRGRRPRKATGGSCWRPSAAGAGDRAGAAGLPGSPSSSTRAVLARPSGSLTSRGLPVPTVATWPVPEQHGHDGRNASMLRPLPHRRIAGRPGYRSCSRRLVGVAVAQRRLAPAPRPRPPPSSGAAVFAVSFAVEPADDHDPAARSAHLPVTQVVST